MVSTILLLLKKLPPKQIHPLWTQTVVSDEIIYNFSQFYI